MAARRKLYHQEEVRDKIRTSQLINRLQDNGLAETEFLTTGQVNSINSLLDRVLPRLKAMTVATDPENPIQFIGRIELVAPKVGGNKPDASPMLPPSRLKLPVRH